MVTHTQTAQRALVPWTSVPIGRRTIRGAARVAVDLVGSLGGVCGSDQAAVRVVDLSSSGARFRGPALEIGQLCELAFLPPGRHERVRLRCQVVRLAAPDNGHGAEVAVACSGPPLSFRLDLVAACARPAPTLFAWTRVAALSPPVPTLFAWTRAAA